MAEAADGAPITDDALRLIQQVLNIDPTNAVGLFYASEAYQERGEAEMARLYLQDLVRHWPRLGDGWLALGRLLAERGEHAEARRCILEARSQGVEEAEEALPQG